MFKRLHLCEASAGSGKTFNLAKRYIQLLKLFLNQQKKDSENIKIPEKLNSILAITFTNKAAAEMKERILNFLKIKAKIYKNYNLDISLNEEEAIQLLIHIIDNQSEFNVITIDSFMNKILRTFAIELNIYPDYEITFNKEDFFELVFSEFITDEVLEDDLIKLLNILLQSEYKGFNGEKIIKKALKNYRDNNFERYLKDNLLLDEKKLINCFNQKFSNLYFNNLFEVNDYIEKRLLELYSKLRETIIENQDFFKKNNIKQILNSEKYEKLPKSKFYKVENPLPYILKKNCSVKLNVEASINNTLKEFKEFYSLKLLLINFMESHEIIKVFKYFLVKEKEIRTYFNIFEGSSIVNEVADFIKSEEDVSYAFCKLGENILHYLIDEFQDTSIEQLNAIISLIQNAAANGGSLFVVGDKKQAIYGWRGGDYKVFQILEEKLKYYSLFKEQIKINFRSAKEIVSFNNNVFKFLEKDKTKDIIFKLFEDYWPESVWEEINNIYNDSEQEVWQGNLKLNGYVEVNLIKNIDNDKDLIYKEYFLNILEKCLTYFKEKDILILLRSKENINNIIAWILEYNLEKENKIKFITEDSLKLISNLEIKNFLLLADFIYNPKNINSLKGLIENNFFQNIGDIDISSLKSENWQDLLDKNVILLKQAIDSSSKLNSYEFFIFLLSKFRNFFQIDKHKVFFDKFLEEVLILSDKQKSITEIVDYFYNNQEITISMPENIDAIKIMTIHKAKGLDAEAVIIPYYDWILFDSRTVEYDLVSLKNWFNKENEYKVFLKLSKQLQDISEEVKINFFEKIKQKFIENLNLMYVANTRAKKALFIIGQYKLTQKEEIPKRITASIMLGSLLDCDFNEENFIYRKGNLVDNKIEESLFDDTPIFQKIDYRPISKKLFLPETLIFGDKDEIDVESKFFGNFFHSVMSFIGMINSEEDLGFIIDEAIKKANSLFYVNDNFSKKAEEYVIKTIKKLKEYFFGIENFWNEKEIISDNGRIYRIDRIVKKNDFYVIIDYKTGKKNQSHLEQIKEYKRLFSKKAKAILFYVKNGEIINV